MNPDLLHIIDKELEDGLHGVLCTVVDSKGSTPRDLGACMWVRPGGSTEGTIGGGPTEKIVVEKALEMMETRSGPQRYEALLRDGESGGQSLCGGDAVILLESLGMEPEIVIFGAGHVGLALARITASSGFRTVVWDEREEYANPDRIPWCRTVACPLEAVFDSGSVSLDGSSYVVVVTRGHSLDEEVLRSLEGCPAAYIGVIGSRAKIAAMRGHLAEKGVSHQFLDSLFQPVGLPIEAETPEEIAISILSEIIAVYRGADIRKLRSPFGNEHGPFGPVFQKHPGKEEE